MEAQLKKLKLEQITAIVASYKKGESIAELARHYSVHRKAIRYWLKKRGTYIKPYEKYTINAKAYEKIDTESKAYVLGFIYADGSIVGNALQIAVHPKDKEILRVVLMTLKSSHPIKKYYYNQSYAVSRIYIKNKKLACLLKKHGVMERKTNRLTVPEIKIHTRHFMRGYFDGDGSISGTNYRPYFSVTGHLPFISEFQEKLMKYCGLNKTKIHYYKHTSAVSLGYCGRKQLRKIFHFLYDDATVFLRRKKEKFNKVTVKEEPKTPLEALKEQNKENKTSAEEPTPNT